MARYDRIGRDYQRKRRPDPRFAALIEEALGDCVSVLNVGAGTGSYESPNRKVVALEPSEMMIRQRPLDAAPAIVGEAERLPLIDQSVDAVTAFMTVHHWLDVPRGLRELRRVARQRIVILTYLPHGEVFPDRWITNVYFPGIAAAHRRRMPARSFFEEALGPVTCIPVLIPHDCTDGFIDAFWGRPEVYLDPSVRNSMSAFQLLNPVELVQGIAQLRADLKHGRWDEQFGKLRNQESMDAGLRLVVAHLSGDRSDEGSDGDSPP
ncbi:MAG TPA: class I SAM-dependent methyltransferase [Pseudomonadota bacterium]|nr:class I SAM-dependent methyltransferase [Pseudomonadota bacterium]HNF95960.1 class I SAM-dependent methyltransferase [Pseudomonadota bacterium]